ncbi:EAL domain-containing protein [Azospirillum picis]|uniref:EAL domain-containing protein (Putative c-di-GMP-specific phosphodiesterase class I)/GGDEF domain-containing protein n=1 Tax=Azospirillum picis TaxID=488438 RepID=A0ABU0MRG7_9PROT|nr:EAL domain-containing protein [Azospirillum picis]MBP2302486.1 EAL domain-containing protein (putative c-di-GMP-specific phosphodiesterase class I)/GGDEF domain-containing protein [Azospirillum picis]MDQ0536065.1 EAL domain-containing protein (putative c-di-GMP-specific phosphodiesterase class I)/GGDEF domain-containing protein [Azospirillum picis]
MTSDVARFLGFAFANADVLIEVDAQGVITFAAGALQNLLGTTDAELIGHSIERVLATGDRGLVRRLLRTAGSNRRLETWGVTLTGGVAAMLSGYRLGLSPNVQLTLTRSESQGKETAQPNRDAETGLVDADAFQAELGERFGVDVGDAPPKLTLIKIADFGEVKSRLGSEMTLRLLSEVGALLRMHAADDTLATRLGEDRFGLVHGKGVDANTLAGEIAIAATGLSPDALPVHAQNLTLDMSAPGLSREDAGRVLMFTVKSFAEETASLDITTMHDAVKLLVDQTVTRVTSLRSTLTDDRLKLQFQPIVTLATRGLHHYEALARFPHGAPGPTIAFAEQVGMVHDVDLLVCEKALDVLAGNKSLQIAINMSAASLSSDLFIVAFQRLVGRQPGLRSRLLVEVTESTDLTDLPRAARILEDLRRAGHRICLDDFGAGAASFPYIQALPVDFVKIDGSYVKRLGGSPRDDAILRAMVALCKEIRVQVIAEMVETADQAGQLNAWGFELAQGYHFGRPTDRPSYEAPSLFAAPAKRQGFQDSWS